MDDVLAYINQLEQHRYEAERKSIFLQEEVNRLQHENKALTRRYEAFRGYLEQLIDRGAVHVSWDFHPTTEGAPSGRFTQSVTQ